MPALTLRHFDRRVLLGRAALAALLVGVMCGNVSGQAVPSEGTRIRVSTDSIASGRWTTGQYISLSSDALRLVSAEGDTVNVPRPAIYHFQMSEGRYPHTVAGLAVGAGAGATIAFVVASVVCSGDSPPGFCPSKGVAALIGGAGGGLLGAFLGNLSKTDRWTRVSLERFPRQP